MLYPLALEPLLHRLRAHLSGVHFTGCRKVFKLSASADDVIALVKAQEDVDVLVKNVNTFGLSSSAKVNRKRSEALLVGDVLSRDIALPAGLTWNKRGIRYIGVFLGNESIVCKNWESMLEKVEGSIKKDGNGFSPNCLLKVVF